MIFPKHYKDKGLILVDILLALSLGTLFTIILFESSALSRMIFENAKERENIIKEYESKAFEFTNLLPGEKVDIDEISSTARWYGNDRIETKIDIAKKIIFNFVKPYPTNSLTNKNPICSTNFFRKGTMISIIPIMLPVDPLLPLSDMEVRNNISYISIDSNRASDPDLIVVNIASSSNPIILSSINTGPGIASLSLVNNRIFAAITSTVSQLQSIKINQINNISLENKYKLPLPSTTTVPTIASAISYYKNYVYLGTEKWDGEEFNILDVSDLSKITKMGSLEIGSKINDIFIWNDLAYLATAARDQLIVVDIKDIQNPRILSTFSPSGWSRQEGKRVSTFEENISFGRTSGGFDIKTDHELFSSASTSLENLDFRVSRNMPGGIYGIVQDRFYTYIISREPGRELQIFSSDITTEPIESYSLPVAPQILTCDNDKLYVLANSAPILYEISFE